MEEDVRVVRQDGLAEYAWQSSQSRLWFVLQVLVIIVAASAVCKAQFYLAAILCLCASLIRCRLEERVLAVRGLGVQIDQWGRLRLFSDRNRFLGVREIQGVFINEVFRGFGVEFVVQIALSGSEDLFLVTKNLRPRLAQQRLIWNGLREILALQLQDSS